MLPTLSSTASSSRNRINGLKGSKTTRIFEMQHKNTKFTQSYYGLEPCKIYVFDYGNNCFTTFDILTEFYINR